MPDTSLQSGPEPHNPVRQLPANNYGTETLRNYRYQRLSRRVAAARNAQLGVKTPLSPLAHAVSLACSQQVGDQLGKSISTAVPCSDG